MTADVNDNGFGSAAYCHHRHHPDEGHNTDFDTCPHPICIAARDAAEDEALMKALQTLFAEVCDALDGEDEKSLQWLRDHYHMAIMNPSHPLAKLYAEWTGDDDED